MKVLGRCAIRDLSVILVPYSFSWKYAQDLMRAKNLLQVRSKRKKLLEPGKRILCTRMGLIHLSWCHNTTHPRTQFV